MSDIEKRLQDAITWYQGVWPVGEKDPDIAGVLCAALDAVRVISNVTSERDKLMERSVGAMAIAEGQEGHEAIPRDCPMLEAVSAMRERLEFAQFQSQQRHEDAQEFYDGRKAALTYAVALREAAKKVLEGFDEEVFIRDVAHDATSSWAMKLLPYIAALSQLAALAKNPNPAGLPSDAAPSGATEGNEASLYLEASGPVGLGPYEARRPQDWPSMELRKNASAAEGAGEVYTAAAFRAFAALLEAPVGPFALPRTPYTEVELLGACRLAFKCIVDNAYSEAPAEELEDAQRDLRRIHRIATASLKMLSAVPDHPQNGIERNWDAFNTLSRRYGEMCDLAQSYRDTACRTLDKAERFGKRDKPLPQDEIDAMTARIVEDDKRLYGKGRPLPPRASGPASLPATSEDNP